MKILKIILLVLATLLVVILVGVGYIWKTLVFTVPPQVKERVSSTTAIVENVGLTDVVVEKEKEGTSEQPRAELQVDTPITITTEKLSEGQKDVLDTLGVGEQSITITPQIVTCAVDALGTERVLELKNGSTPTLAESLTLLACIK